MQFNPSRELNHSITSNIPALDIKLIIEPDEDVVQLVEEDLQEEDDDEDDDEYDPNKDEEVEVSAIGIGRMQLNNTIRISFQSDDYSTATCSDIESQPRTPGEALTLCDADDSPNKCNPEVVQYDEDGFKIPSEPKSPIKPIQEEMVARRTRSKMSLTTTPIETIEKTFAYPVPKKEVDVPWKEFLEQFHHPLGEYTRGSGHFPLTNLKPKLRFSVLTCEKV